MDILNGYFKIMQYTFTMDFDVGTHFALTPQFSVAEWTLEP